MNAYRTRRATADDLAQLAALWQAAQLPAADLAKRFTDFQVAEDEPGQLAGAIGLHIEGGQGRVHSEAFADPALAGPLRAVLWQRLQTVAQNHGLFRLWTEETAAWWRQDAGFSAPSDELLEKLPEPYGARHAAWLTLRLREEMADAARLDRELQFYKEAERARLENIMRWGKAVIVIVTSILALVLLFALALLAYVVKHRG
jgi:N-acetylglutamate synthase-like GNAT family acetyltransferase